MITSFPAQSARHRTMGLPFLGGRGFTLLELIVVMTILSVISMAVVPVFLSGMTAVEVRNARSDFIATLRFVQELAVKESREYRVYISEEDGTYWVMRLSGLKDTEKQFEPVEEEFGAEKRFPEFLKITRIKARRDRGGNARFIACLPNGASDQAVVSLQDQRVRGRSFDIEVKGVLGKVEIKE
ncbi:MAG: type II secretion system protein [Candidatus Hydrogenedens sp.]|nr:type II secretion system protein [Candidatus Hydrogenedentota bacterium]NLF58513.1 type II secretion system protein [Candidatus Hydrogenedens sp.]